MNRSLIGQSPIGKAIISPLILAAALCSLAFPAMAIPIISPIGSSGAELDLKWDLSNASDQTGVRVKNLSQNGGSVEIELLPGANGFGLQLPTGFVLLDNTLKVTSDLEAGGRRIRARMDLGRYGGRASLRRQGIRANTLRLLRADFNGGRWIRAIDSIRDKVRADIRFLTAIRANLVLGHHGVDSQNEFVWAVLDTSGEQFFAVAGVSSPVPLPATLLLFLTGSGMLVLVSRRRRVPTS